MCDCVSNWQLLTRVAACTPSAFPLREPSPPQLGSYKPQKAVKLVHQGRGVWTAECEVVAGVARLPFRSTRKMSLVPCPPTVAQVEEDTVVQYRYLIRDTKSNKIITESDIFRRVCLVRTLASSHTTVGVFCCPCRPAPACLRLPTPSSDCAPDPGL